MDDLISRQDLFAEMKQMYKDAEKWRQEATYSDIKARAESCMATLIEMKLRIEKMSSAQQWIPCSEETGKGYPKEDGFYYVTEQNYGFYLDADCKMRVAHTSHFIDGAFTDRFYDENHSNITAWMPLPEPYKERE